MKESTIIQNFNVLNNKHNKLTELTQQNMRQLYMVQTAIGMTLEALVSLLMEKGVFTQEEYKSIMKNQQEKRAGKAVEEKQKEIETQPIIDTNSEVPGPDMDNDAEVPGPEGENNE